MRIRALYAAAVAPSRYKESPPLKNATVSVALRVLVLRLTIRLVVGGAADRSTLRPSVEAGDMLGKLAKHPGGHTTIVAV
jgi:hypothetical protein